MLWSINDERQDALYVELPYFETLEPFVYEDGGTYVDTDATFVHNITHTWNHGIGETIMALLGAGLELTMFVEHDSVPWEALPGQMVEDDNEEWRLRENPGRLAASLHPAGDEATGDQAAMTRGRPARRRWRGARLSSAPARWLRSGRRRRG